MVQFNLLPDVKLQYIKARRTKYAVMMVSSVVGAVALALFLITLLWVNGAQKKRISDLNKDIKRYSTNLKQVPDLDKILTVQNQLRTLPELHENKAAVTRLYNYLSQVTPNEVALNQLTADYDAGVITVGGTAPNMDAVRKYTDTLKVTKYKVDDSQSANQKAFKDVVLSAFGRDDKGATFTITFGYDPTIFDITKKVDFEVPNGLMTTQTNLFGTEK